MKNLPAILCAIWLFPGPTAVNAALTASLNPNTQNAARGTELVFSGTLTNTSSTNTLFLNDIHALLIGGASNYVSLNSNTFFANVPGILLPGEVYSGVIFRVLLEDIAPAGDYLGTITLQGGGDIFATNDLASADFVILSPAVNILATDPTASEFGPEAGTITISRTGGTNIDLAVPFVISGTATNGITYNLIPSTVTIPAGAVSATITITPIPDDLAQGSRTALLSLATSAAYNLGSNLTATITVQDKPVDTWRLQKFGAGANDPAAADPADWDSDGILNLLEYALNLEPTMADAGALPVPEITGGFLLLSFVPNPAAIDIVNFVEASTNLAGWSTNDVELVFVPNPDPPGRVTVRYSHPVSVTERAFLRLRVSRASGGP